MDERLRASVYWYMFHCLFLCLPEINECASLRHFTSGVVVEMFLCLKFAFSLHVAMDLCLLANIIMYLHHVVLTHAHTPHTHTSHTHSHVHIIIPTQVLPGNTWCYCSV